MKKAVEGKSLQPNHSLLARDMIVPSKMKNLCPARNCDEIATSGAGIKNFVQQVHFGITFGVSHAKQLKLDLVYESAIKRITDLSAMLLSLNYFK